MADHEDKIPDEWDIKLDNMIIELNNCQKSNSLKTCSDCGKFFECELRKKYVNALLKLDKGDYNELFKMFLD